MIRLCSFDDFQDICEIINDAAQAYKGVIPPDRYHVPYMAQEKLAEEIADGVIFWGYEEQGRLLGVMGIQDVRDVTLIRHAYVRTTRRGKGIGTRLLNHLRTLTEKPVLIGTWRDAVWAVSFYEKNGFCLVDDETKNRLLRKYWTVPDRQVETSVVLADANSLASVTSADRV